MMKLFKDPLFHFLVIGGAVFLCYLWLQPVSEEEVADTNPLIIQVSQSQIDTLHHAFTNAWQRPPTEDETQMVLDEWIKEEVYYREALALGLDKDDPTIRGHMRDKMEFLSTDLSQPADPTTEDLQAFMDTYPGDFRIDATYSLKQVFFHNGRRGDLVNKDAVAALNLLRAGGDGVDPASMGDTGFLEPSVTEADLSMLQRTYGRRFAEAVIDLDIGRWHGPIATGFGEHLVFLEKRMPARLPALDQIREEVVEAWRYDQMKNANMARFEELKSRYTIIMEDAPESP